MQTQHKTIRHRQVCTKSRSRSQLRNPTTDYTHPKLPKLFTKNNPKFLEDTTPKSISRELLKKSRGKKRRTSVHSSNFSRVQTAVEETGESMDKAEFNGSYQEEEEEPGHFEFQLGEVLNKKYKHICDGTFGRVMEVEDIKDSNKMHYALKIIRPVERYIEAAKDEANILKKLPLNQNIIPLIDTFYHKHHYCILTPLYGPSLAEFIQNNKYQGYPIASIQSMLRQLIQSLAFIHAMGLAHTDLKPENILLTAKDYETFADEYKVPTSDNIVLIDFGNATFSTEHHSRIINTREYRCPEVLLQCCKWSEISDMWSVGCIACELYNGECLFGGMHEEGEEDLGLLEHLTMVEKISGAIPEWMGYAAGQKIQQLAVKRKLRSQKGVQLRVDKLRSNKEIMKSVEEMIAIDDIIDQEEYPELVDLVKKLLTIDPIKRISAKDALEHPFFSIKYD